MNMMFLKKIFRVIIKKLFGIDYYELDYRKWLINRFYPKKVPNDIDLIVSSIGGTATTCLLDFLSNYLKTNDSYDLDQLKHSRRYKLSKFQKVIFIIAEPKDAYRSLSRRNYLYFNCNKLGFISYFIRIKIIFIIEAHILQSYMEMLSKKYPNQYLSIKYEELFSSAQIIKDFAGLNDDEFIKKFPSKKERLSQ